MFVGCSSKEDEDTEVDSNAVEPNVTAEIPRKNIVVTVNGIDITEEALEEKIQAEIVRKKVPIPPEFLKQYKQELRRKILDDIIVELLLEQKVKENRIVVTEEDVDRRIRQLNAKNQMSMKNFLEMLEAMGKNLDEYKQNLRKRLSHEKFLQVKLFDSIKITGEDAKKYYSENPEKFQSLEGGSFEQVKDAIIERLYKNKQKALFSEYIIKLKQEARIVYPAGEGQQP